MSEDFTFVWSVGRLRLHRSDCPVGRRIAPTYRREASTIGEARRRGGPRLGPCAICLGDIPWPDPPRRVPTGAYVWSRRTRCLHLAACRYVKAIADPVATDDLDRARRHCHGGCATCGSERLFRRSSPNGRVAALPALTVVSFG